MKPRLPKVFNRKAVSYSFISENSVWNLLRITLGFIFLWAFFDKLLGLGFSTPPERSWLNGTSPTSGFLANAPEGPLAGIFNVMSGNIVVDLLFMGGLLGVGLALMLGIGLTIASYSGSLMMFMIYLSLFPGENNPLVDEHIVYIIVLLGLGRRAEKQDFGLSRAWSKTGLVKRYPVLR